MTDPRNAPARSILVVDDDETFRAVLARALRVRYEVATAGSYEDAIARGLVDGPDCALVDLQMPGRSGFELIAAIKRIHPATIVVVLTADRSPESKAAATERGASGYLTKPTDADEVIAALRAASEHPS